MDTQAPYEYVLAFNQSGALGSSNPSITTLSCDGLTSVSGRPSTFPVHSGSSSYFLDDSGLVLSSSASSGEMMAGESRARPSLILSSNDLTSRAGMQARNAYQAGFSSLWSDISFTAQLRCFQKYSSDLRRRIRTDDAVRRVVCLRIHLPGPGTCGLKHQKSILIGDSRSLEGVEEGILDTRSNLI